MVREFWAEKIKILIGAVNMATYWQDAMLLSSTIIPDEIHIESLLKQIR